MKVRWPGGHNEDGVLCSVPFGGQRGCREQRTAPAGLGVGNPFDACAELVANYELVRSAFSYTIAVKLCCKSTNGCALNCRFGCCLLLNAKDPQTTKNKITAPINSLC